MNITRRNAVAALASGLLLPATGHAAQWPSQPVRIVVPFAAGNATDIILRQVAQRLSEAFGQPFIIDNRTGAGGIIGYDAVAKSRSDGYTLGGTMATFATNRLLYRSVPYDELKDFVPVATVSRTPMVLTVGPSIEARDLAQFTAAAAARQTPFNYAATSASNQLNAEMVFMRLGIKLQVIPYRDSGPAGSDLMTGRVDAMLNTLNAAMPQMQGGRVRPLAVMSAARSPVLPDVPTAKELKLGDLDIWSWQGILAPAGTPEPIIERLHAAINDVLKDEGFQVRLREQGYEPYTMSRDGFATLIRTEMAAYAEVARETGLKPE
jgi:tripartite-type tricarboxylate transporter receptor subunit TctC